MTVELAQVLIGLTGCAALLLLASNTTWGRWGYVVGLLGQPAWLWCTWSASQFGMFFVSVCFTIVYAWGGWHAWIQPRRSAR